MKNTLRLSVYLVILSLTITQQIFAQGETNRWYFGRRAGFDFSTTPPTMLSNSPYAGGGDVEEAHATISDAAGNYLFYTNGQTIWTNTGAAMPNGTGLNGHWSTTQCATVFPVPGSTTDYYILTTPLTGSSNELQWNRVDMSLNGGLGDIKTPVASNKNQVMPSCPTYMMESVVSVPHFNGTDIWVIAHTSDDPGTGGNEGGSFVVWLITSAGIAYSNTYTLGYAYPADPSGPTSRGIGIMKSNSCFNRIFISYYNASSRVEGFSFSNSTGVVSNWPAPISGPLVIDQFRNTSNTLGAIGSFSYGLEISGNGRYLYNTRSGEGGDRTLNQYDLQAGTGTNADINNSAVRLSPAAPDGVRYGQLQMGPDGKIYHTLHNWNNVGAGGYCKIGVVNAPNTGGAGANFVEVAYNWAVNGTGSTMGLPSFHKGFVAGRPNITSSVSNLEEICLGDPLDLTAVTAGTTVTSYSWNIDKNLNATIDYSGAALSSISHTYGSTGSYTVELTVVDQCGYTYKSESPVIVLAKPTSAGTVSCGTPVRGNVTAPNGSYTYVWYSDAAATSPIATGTTNVSLPITGAGNVYLKATSGSSSSSVALTNGTDTDLAPWGGTNDPGTIHTTGFTVTKAPLTFGSFKWEAPYGAYNAVNVNITFTVTLRSTGGTVYYTNTRTMAYDGPTWASGYPYTETVNTALPLGTYEIVIARTAGAVGGEIKRMSPCTANQLDSEGALTFNSSGSCGMTGGYTYSLTKYTVTPLPCSQVATVPYNCPLPVTWLSFDAYRIGNSNSVQLDWVTSLEQNSDFFTIQRSVDGINFETIGKVEAQGNSNKLFSYQFADNNAPLGKVYYRLNEVDFDNKGQYSEIRTVGGAGGINISLVPNPSNGNFTILGIEENTLISVSIYSYTGQLVYSSDSVLANETVNISQLPKGVYLVKVINASSVQTIQLINQ